MAHIRRHMASLLFLQDADNLFLAESALLHGPSPVRTDSTSFWRKFRGAGHWQ
jgi:hypothetical protein